MCSSAQLCIDSCCLFSLYVFLSRVSMSMHVERDIVMANLSVCPSVTRWYCIEMNARVVKRFAQSARGMTLVFESYHGHEIPRGTSSTGALNTRGWEKNSPFIRETVRDRAVVTVDY